MFVLHHGRLETSLMPKPTPDELRKRLTGLEPGERPRRSSSGFRARFRSAQPRWSLWLGRLVSLPAFGLWLIAFLSWGDGRPMPRWGVGAFITLFSVAGIQWSFYLGRKFISLASAVREAVGRGKSN